MLQIDFRRPVLALMCFLVSMVTLAEEHDYEPIKEEPGSGQYQLQAGDFIHVSVFGEDSLSREILIRPDGGMSFPLAGDFQVAGLSASELTADLEARLDRFVPDASVTVSVLQINGNQVFVLGKVNRPGAYPLFRALDVMQVLALAGGTSQFAASDDIRILRRDSNGYQEVSEFKYSEVVNGRSLEQNILLKSGDTVVVP